MRPVTTPSEVDSSPRDSDLGAVEIGDEPPQPVIQSSLLVTSPGTHIHRYLRGWGHRVADRSARDDVRADCRSTLQILKLEHGENLMCRFDDRVDAGLRLDTLVGRMTLDLDDVLAGSLALQLEVAAWTGRLQHQGEVGGHSCILDASTRTNGTHFFIGIEQNLEIGRIAICSVEPTQEKENNRRPAFMSKTPGP